MPDSALPPHMRKPHNDWPWPFSKISRGLTAFNWGKPKKVLGNQKRIIRKAPAPIGEPGSWQISRFPHGPWFAWYIAFTLPGGRHFRLGARWDDVDTHTGAPNGYTQWPSIATRKYPIENEGERDTSV